MIYLNDGFEGGALNFLRHPWSGAASQRDRDADIRQGAKVGNIMAQVQCTHGRGLVLEHSFALTSTIAHRSNLRPAWLRYSANACFTKELPSYVG